jgi:hypothetical protein
MTSLSTRLPHIVTRADLATLLTPTYGSAQSVDDDEAHDRLTRALADPDLLDDLHASLAQALATHLGPRTDEDALLDKLSKRVSARKGRMKPADSAKVAALLVHVNLLLGLAPEGMRAVLESDKGRANLSEALRATGAHLVHELLK